MEEQTNEYYSCRPFLYGFVYYILSAELLCVVKILTESYVRDVCASPVISNMEV